MDGDSDNMILIVPSGAAGELHRYLHANYLTC